MRGEGGGPNADVDVDVPMGWGERGAWSLAVVAKGAVCGMGYLEQDSPGR